MPNELNRRLGLSQLLFVSVGAIIGSAWLFAPLFAAQAAGRGDGAKPGKRRGRPRVSADSK